MINNGGFVLAFISTATGLRAAGWIPLVAPITLSESALAVTEGLSGDYTVRLAAQPTAAVTIRVASSSAGVTVKAGLNPAGASQDIEFEADDTNSKIWSRAQTVTVEALSDDNLLDESVTLSHGVASGSAPEYIGGAAEVNVNVMDDDYPGLSITGASASEGAGTLDFTVTLSMASSRRVTVDWAVDGGTATPGTATSGDYDSGAASGTLVFGSPQIQTISVPINDDSVSEGDETVKVALRNLRPSEVRISGSSVATGTIVDDDERTAVGAGSGESPFSVGDTTVTVDSALPADTGLEVVLPSELESGGEAIENLVITLRPTDADVEIDAGRFGYTGDDADHVLVDVVVSPVPDAAVKICLPVTEELRLAAGERRLYLIRFSGGNWEELSSTTEGGMVCADVSGFAPFAVVYELMNSGSGGGNSGEGTLGSGGDGGCAISGENRFASPVLPAMLLMPLLFFGRFRKKGRRFP